MNARKKLKKVGLAALSVFGLLAVYFVFYFTVFTPSLPSLDSTAGRYLSRVQNGDWKGVAVMHANRRSGEGTVAEWKKIRAEFGPIRRVRLEGVRTVKFPAFTRGMTAYTIQTDRGDLLALMDMKARFGSWKVREARITFQPPQPFSQPNQSASR
ncbi:MAG: hypothetical protein KY468_20015 [Armatimonadetes bacterium]|nr:hypothetical protein [Armatimonadota bacterium]